MFVLNGISIGTKAKTKTGLIRGHAYSITNIVEVKIHTSRIEYSFPLVRLRNPWGNSEEWNRDWSDGSQLWKSVSDKEKARIGLSFKSDGEFYMSQTDFMANFECLESCHLSPDSWGQQSPNPAKLNWYMEHVNGSWRRGLTSGGCRSYLSSFGQFPKAQQVIPF